MRAHEGLGAPAGTPPVHHMNHVCAHAYMNVAVLACLVSPERIELVRFLTPQICDT